VTESDLLFLDAAIELASNGLFSTTPNPRVGCVLVRDGRVIGRGWHHRAGGPHAEVEALTDAARQSPDQSSKGRPVTFRSNHAHITARRRRAPTR
jgi:pyrimidine deaminase RibD-like protein